MSKYISPSKCASAQIVEKKSRFIAHISHVETVAEAQNFILEKKKEYYDARHNVYAYILKNGEEKYSDDGEPSKTGGFPVLEFLKKECITDVVCVVTRYFGGILLGTGGLVRAYSKACKEAVALSDVKEKTLCITLEILMDYPIFDTFMHISKEKGVKITDTKYLEKINTTAYVKEELLEEYVKKLKDTFLENIRIEKSGTVFD